VLPVAEEADRVTAGGVGYEDRVQLATAGTLRQ